MDDIKTMNPLKTGLPFSNNSGVEVSENLTNRIHITSRVKLYTRILIFQKDKDYPGIIFFLFPGLGIGMQIEGVVHYSGKHLLKNIVLVQ